MEQRIIQVNGQYDQLKKCFDEANAKKILLVCDSAYRFLKVSDFFESLGDRVVSFSNFQPNPLYESVVEGVDLLHREECDMIVAVGGGSAIDVAKCIKLYSNMNPEENYLRQSIVPNDLPLVAMPTTAGTGSEATRYAVIYYEGDKQSVADYSCIPTTVIFDASVLKTLPVYQKKSTMMDALCHAIESYWSVNSTEESKEYSRQAIQGVMKNAVGYLSNNDDANAAMLRAANLAGKAINITQTTGGHAMCYKITSLYGVAHGHAAALCVRKLWPWMIENTDRCIDPRGQEYLNSIFSEIAESMGADSAVEAVEMFDRLFKSMDLSVPSASNEDIEKLSASVNPVRLKNNPVSIVGFTEKLYEEILGVCV